MILQGPQSTSMQISTERGNPPKFYLALVAKRTFDFDHHGRLCVSAEQEPLLGMSGDTARDGCLEHDSDIWPSKPMTDVVVQGHLYPRSPTARFTAQVQIGPVVKDLLVTGDRKVARALDGRLVFSPPSVIEKIPLTYARAYGGIDRVSEGKYGNPMMVFDKYRRPEFQPEYHSPFIYPRNAAGRGYLIEASPEAVDALELPNIEDPRDPVTEQRLIVGRVKRWPLMPLPWGTNWLHPAAFPRCAYMGAVRQFEVSEPQWLEVMRGLVERDFPLFGGSYGPVEHVHHPRFANGGSLGLQLSPFGGSLGGIDVRLHGFAPGGCPLVFRLPGHAPTLLVDGRNGKLQKTSPVLHHVVLRPDEHKVAMVWRGEIEAQRLYKDEELDAMPHAVEWSA